MTLGLGEETEIGFYDRGRKPFSAKKIRLNLSPELNTKIYFLFFFLTVLRINPRIPCV